jgi:putative membrane protein
MTTTSALDRWIAAGAVASVAAVVSVVTGGVATAQTAKQPHASEPMPKLAQSGSLNAADRKFVEQAAMGGVAEAEAGRLAQQKAGNDSVTQYAARIVEDHDNANTELRQIATAKSVTLPNAPDAVHQAEMKRLETMTGPQFDREFTRMMVRDHETVVAAFDKQAKSGSDPELKAFAAKTLPTLRTHLQMAKQVQTRAGAASAASR